MLIELIPAIAEIVASTAAGAGVAEMVEDLDIPDLFK